MAGYILHPVEYILRRLVEKRKTGGARGGWLGHRDRSLEGVVHRGRHITVFHDGFKKRYMGGVMYDVTKEEVFLLFALVLAALIYCL
jgi:hypothetical protein